MFKKNKNATYSKSQFFLEGATGNTEETIRLDPVVELDLDHPVMNDYVTKEGNSRFYLEKPGFLEEKMEIIEVNKIKIESISEALIFLFKKVTTDGVAEDHPALYRSYLKDIEKLGELQSRYQSQIDNAEKVIAEKMQGSFMTF